MRPAFNITCKQTDCNSSFSVELFRIANKDKIVCPNCGQEFPTDKIDSLKQLAKSYLDIKALTSTWLVNINA